MADVIFSFAPIAVSMQQVSMTNRRTSQMIESPLVFGARASLVAEIDASRIIEGYYTEYGYDVSAYFAGIPHVGVYECSSSGYRFYYPFSLVGEEGLYRHLQQFDWNYKPHKWEYARASEFIPNEAQVLDVGCGQGAFLAITSERGLRATGLELNSSAAGIARNAGLNVSCETVQDHARRYPEKYDAVCSFQVLEHVPNAHDFIAGCISALKEGGTLIFGVPNNDSFLKDADAVLNMPPHHMGLWTKRSLSSLSTLFPLRLRSIEKEPLAEIDWYVAVMERRYLKNRLLRSAYYKLGLSQATRWLTRHCSQQIAGHTILAIYTKIGPTE